LQERCFIEGRYDVFQTECTTITPKLLSIVIIKLVG
jgi:hypothetical protein